MRNVGWLGLALLGGCANDAGSGGDTAVIGTAEESVLRYEMSPTVAARGSTVAVRVTSTVSAMVFGDTDLDFGADISVDSVTVFDSYTVEAVITVGAAAELGPRVVTLSLGGSNTELAQSFVVVDESISVAPDNAKMGEMITVEVTGVGTDWSQGYTWASFGEGVEVLDVDILSETEALATLAIRRMRDMGCSSVTLETEVTNDAAIRLYEDRLGFVREELLVRYYLNWGDAYRLRLWFD